MTDTMKHKPFVIVLSGASGVGKSSVRELLLKRKEDLAYSISATTRLPRQNEINGRDYIFMDRKEFEKGIENNAFLEWAEVHGSFYGTPADFVNQKLSESGEVLLDIDVKGTKQIKKIFPDGVFIFLMPPSIDSLIARLSNRGSESKEKILLRLKNAIDEFQQIELYDFLVINDKLENAVSCIISIIQSERLRRSRFGSDADEVLSKFAINKNILLSAVKEV